MEIYLHFSIRLEGFFSYLKTGTILPLYLYTNLYGIQEVFSCEVLTYRPIECTSISLTRTFEICFEVCRFKCFSIQIYKLCGRQWRTEGGRGLGCSNSPPQKFRRPSKIVPNSTQFVKTVKNC